MKEILICTAIRQKRLLEFDYERHSRLVEPHLLGYYVGGDLTLLAWQLFGGSRGEGWRYFQLSEMSSPAVVEGTSRAPRPSYDPSDDSFEEVLCHL